MHTYVYCSTIYNSKDLEPTQMPIDNRLDIENVAHKHHGILHSHKKEKVHVLRRDMGEAKSHHSQPTNTCSHEWMLNNENTWTQGGKHHTPGPVVGWEARGGRALGQIFNACRA